MCGLSCARKSARVQTIFICQCTHSYSFHTIFFTVLDRCRCPIVKEVSYLQMQLLSYFDGTVVIHALLLPLVAHMLLLESIKNF